MSNLPRSFMRQETDEIPAIINRFLVHVEPVLKQASALFSTRLPALVTTAARGSSDNAAMFFKYFLEIGTGIPVVSIGPSVASIYGGQLRLERAIHFTISQSGASPDILALQATAKEGGAPTVAIVNVMNSPLARAADIVIPLEAGLEQSVAATKSCLAACVVLAALAIEIGKDRKGRHALIRLPQCLEAALLPPGEALIDWLAGQRQAYITGRGTGLAVAQEAALKAKEICAIHAEALSLAEIMHGPLRLVENNFPILAFIGAQGSDRQPSLVALERLAALGGDILTVGAPAPFGRALHVPTTGYPLLDPLVALTKFYGLIEAVARARGLDPDRPHYLEKVTKTV